MKGWDPEQYLRFADERALPFRHLVAAIRHSRPRAVADLGCGPGGLTATLVDRWPSATIWGVDSSPEMIERAAPRAIPDRLHFVRADVCSWQPGSPLDVVLSNACFHWIADHERLLDRLPGLLAPGGVLAFQVPNNSAAPSHALLAGLLESAEWAPRVGEARQPTAARASWYGERLAAAGLAVTTWETTYLHRLHGDNPVLEWIRGTTLRPVLDLLDATGRERLLGEYGALLRDAYPQRGKVTVYPFTRVFVVATSTAR